MSGPSPGRKLRSKTSEIQLFRSSASASSRSQVLVSDRLLPPVPDLPVSETKTKRKLTLFGKRRKSSSTVSPDSPARPSHDISDLPRRSTDAMPSSQWFFQNYKTSSSVDASFHGLPSRLPPLDVSPPSLGFSTTGSSPTASPLRIQAFSETLRADASSRHRSPEKGQTRPIIKVSVPTLHSGTEVDEDVFISPRSAPIPPARPIRSAERDTNKSSSAHVFRTPTSTPGSPLRFPIPPGEGPFLLPESNECREDQPEFNSGFSFPIKDTGKESSSRERVGRSGSVDVMANRNQDKQASHTRIASSPSRQNLIPESRKALEFLSAKNDPPTMPLPAPPSAFSIDSEPSTSLASMPTIPSLNSNSSLVSTQSRNTRPSSRSKSTSLTSRLSDSPQREQCVVDKNHLEHAHKQSVGEMREQNILRIEVNAQKARLEELAAKVVKIVEEQEIERSEMRKRIEVLEEEARDMKREIMRLTFAVRDQEDLKECDRKAGLLETPASTMEGIEDFLTTPSDIASPSAFQYARRLLSTTPKFEKTLRRSNTMPDGFDGSVMESRMTPGKKNNRSSSNWALVASGLLPKFAGRGSNEFKGLEPKGLGLEFAMDSPLIKEDSRLTESTSVPVSSTGARGTIMTNAKSPNAEKLTPLSERLRGTRGREDQSSPPNMEEILARLRLFESHSPAFR